MRGVERGLLWFVCGIVTPGMALASGATHEVELESGFTLLMRFVNFALLAGLLYYFLRRPIKNFLDQRQQGVKEALEEAQKATEEAQARYKEMERRLAQAQKEMEELRQMIIEQGHREKERILARARAEAEKIRRQAEIAAEQEFKKAQALLRREAVELATRLAETILRQRLTASDHKRLVDDYLENVGKMAS